MRATLLLLFLGLVPACDRTHLHASYGVSVRRALKAQVIDPAAGERRAHAEGLDPEEAGIVSKGYRESLSPKKEESGRVPILLLPNPQPGVPSMTPTAPPR